MKEYDYIIAGGGCAGLMLAHFINNSELADKKLLILDYRQKCTNDRTWCYWEKNGGLFDEIVIKKWNLLDFHAVEKLIPLNIHPYYYKMIRGIDFYEFMKKSIAANSNIEWIQDRVENIIDNKENVLVNTLQNTFSGKFVFNSLPVEPDLFDQKYAHIIQHFLGWFIETKNDTFNPEKPVFMDFRIEQKGEMRFVYVLPIDTKRALVEYTIFSTKLSNGIEFRTELVKYITDILNLKDYKIIDKEFGKIHLTNYPFRIRESKHIINIGSRAGMIKPSTGFAFTKIQRQSEAIAYSLIKNRHPFYSRSLFKMRFRLFDKTYLNALVNDLDKGNIYLSNMFVKNKSNRMFRYLNEESTVAEEFSVFFTVDIPKFTKALGRVLMGIR